MTIIYTNYKIIINLKVIVLDTYNDKIIKNNKN